MDEDLYKSQLLELEFASDKRVEAEKNYLEKRLDKNNENIQEENHENDRKLRI